jgi:FdhD protein
MEVRVFHASGRDVSPAAFGRLLSETGESAAVWQVAEETPVAILVNGESFAVMMATPEDLEDFATGFAITEGLVERAEEIERLGVAEAADGYVANLRIDPARAARAADRRRSLAGRAGCGICGAQTIEAALPVPRRVPRRPLPSTAALMAAREALPAHQHMKRLNRSTHAAAFCRPDGTLETAREDIGRHNALDKLAGALARAGRDASDGFVLLSSRVSVEMVQKAAAIAAPTLVAVSPPSALALRMAGRAGMRVAGFAGDAIMLFDPDISPEQAT